jgi:sugar (pentulose or hexulose) kinase
MFRSVLEGIALTMKNHARAMCDERDISLKKIIVSGGGSRGDLFMQIFADVFGVPAYRNVVTGSASMGAAICTALALGVYKNRQEALNNMVRQKDIFTPDEVNVKLYDKINNEVYRQIVPATDDLLKKSHQIFNPGRLV